MPLIVRVDGRAFHTLTKKFDKPFDSTFINAMLYATDKTASEMQGFKCAYVQSDEATFLLTDYDSLNCQGWFDYNISKIVSVTASLMSVYFNDYLRNRMDDEKLTENLSVFDARAFNVPIDEVTNTFLWRAKDWHKNSIQMLARNHFNHKELQKKNTGQLLEMLRSINVPWEDLDNIYKNGTFFVNSNELEKKFSVTGFSFISEVLPTFESINKIIKPLITFNYEEDK